MAQFIDPRDGKAYACVKIGNQVWMAENLNYTGVGVVSYPVNGDDANDAVYGRLYKWADLPQLAPPGWHVPTNAEWNELVSYAGTNPGPKLRADSDLWTSERGTDDFGFAALPGGVMYDDGTYPSGYLGSRAYFWSATENSTSNGTYYYTFASTSPNTFGNGGVAKGRALSVRLVKDDTELPGGDDTPPGGDDTPPGGDDTPPGGDDTPPGGDVGGEPSSNNTEYVYVGDGEWQLLQGTDGTVGAKGDKGDKGEQGEKGDKGDKGDQGDAGADGAKGDKGDKGDPGDPGSGSGGVGPAGPAGPPGPTGPEGPRGATGATGAAGATGAEGLGFWATATQLGTSGTTSSVNCVAQSGRTVKLGDLVVSSHASSPGIFGRVTAVDLQTSVTVTYQGSIRGATGAAGSPGSGGITNPMSPALTIAGAISNTSSSATSNIAADKAYLILKNTTSAVANNDGTRVRIGAYSNATMGGWIQGFEANGSDTSGYLAINPRGGMVDIGGPSSIRANLNVFGDVIGNNNMALNGSASNLRVGGETERHTVVQGEGIKINANSGVDNSLILNRYMLGFHGNRDGSLTNTRQGSWIVYKEGTGTDSKLIFAVNTSTNVSSPSWRQILVLRYATGASTLS